MRNPQNLRRTLITDKNGKRTHVWKKLQPAPIATKPAEGSLPVLSKRLVKKSKRLAYMLRHDPSSSNITLSEDGYVPVNAVVEVLHVTRDELALLVGADTKNRFEVDATGTKVRARQGHSLSTVNVPLTVADDTVLPRGSVLYHGTKTLLLPVLHREGLKPMGRNHVHLSADKTTARTVADRRAGTSTILTIPVDGLRKAGIAVYASSNGVYLTADIPPQYITFP